MLDTDTSIYIIKKRPVSAKKQFDKLSMDQVCVSVVTYAELLYGAEHSASQERNRASVNDFIRYLTVHDWTNEAAEHYSVIRHALDAIGTPIGSMDLMIAAHAKSLNAVLITNNERHFSRVNGLRLVNWLK